MCILNYIYTYSTYYFLIHHKEKRERRRRRYVINVGALVTKRKTYPDDDDAMEEEKKNVFGWAPPTYICITCSAQLKTNYEQPTREQQRSK